MKLPRTIYLKTLLTLLGVGVLAMSSIGVALADPAGRPHSSFGHSRPDDRGGRLGIGSSLAPVTAVRPDDRGGTRLPATNGWPIRGIGAVDAATPTSSTGVVATNGWPVRGIGAVDATTRTSSTGRAVRPDDRSGVRGVGASVMGSDMPTPAGRGFGWGDAALGVAGTLGVILLGGGLALSTVRRHRRASLQTAATPALHS